MANNACLVLVVFFFVLVQVFLYIDLAFQQLQLLFLFLLEQLLPLIQLLLVHILLHTVLSSLCFK